MLPAEALQEIALHVAQDREVSSVLRGLVDRLAHDESVALARVWLLEPGDICPTCPRRDECPDRARCLHLEASAGRSQVDPALHWTEVDGLFRRVPLGVHKVGQVAASGEPELLEVSAGARWLADPEWAGREGIRCFAGQPLIFRGEVLGVLGLFCRELLTTDAFRWLKTFAHQAAVAIANARAFEAVERLTRQLELERDYLREEIQVARNLGGIVGRSPAIQKVLQQVELVAPSETSVLILGESGTGKELVATAVHEHSARRSGPLVRVNCASIPRELFESEFFGHSRGAFTGAARARAGRFRVADGGTLFLDEVGEIPLELQGKLLRVLQEGELSPVGEDRVESVDVRVVAATNRDLEEEVAAGRFREDLYYRLSVFPIRVPPLRERRKDVAPLAQHFLERRPGGAGGLSLRAADVRALESYDWPGNVRELQNVIERAALLARGGRLRLDLRASTERPARRSKEPAERDDDRVLTAEEVDELVRRNLLRALERCDWKVSGPGGAAELLGMNPNTLSSRMRAAGLRRPRR